MLHKIELKGFRLLADFTADLDRLTVVIGANATGKSTLLDALHLISQAVSGPLHPAVTILGGVGSAATAGPTQSGFEWSLSFSRSDDHWRWSSMPIVSNERYVYQVRITPDAYLQPQATYEVLRKEKPHEGHKETFKLLEADQRGSRIYDFRQKKFVPFDEAKPAPGSNDQGVAPVALPAEQEKKVPDEGSLLLSRMRFPNEFPQPSWIRAFLADMHFFPGFDVGRFAPIRIKAAEIRPSTALNTGGDNLGTVLHEILTRHNYRESADELREFMRTAYPFFEDVYAETALGAEPRVQVRFREKGMRRPIELWEISDGMLRFLCLSVALLNPAPPALIAVDEPETGLHPRLLPIVADMIKAASEKTQVLITTHSPVLLNCFSLDQVAVMAREESRAAWFRPRERDTLRKMLESVVDDSLGKLHESGELEALR